MGNHARHLKWVPWEFNFHIHPVKRLSFSLSNQQDTQALFCRNA